MTRARPALRLLFLLLLLIPAGAAQDKRALTFADIIEQREPSSPRLSPDGRTVAFLIRQSSLAENSSRTELWLAGESLPAPRRLMASSAAGLKWLPDGRALSAILPRPGETALWRISTETEDVQPLFEHPTPVMQYDWSPDGSRLLFVTVPPVPAEERSRIEREGVVYDENFHGIRSFTQRSWTAPGRPELWLWEKGTTAARRIDADLGGVTSLLGLAWAPSGRQAAISYTEAGPGERIGLLDLDRTPFAFRPFVQDGLRNRGVAWSSDGRRLAFVATGEEGKTYVPRSRPLLRALEENSLPAPVAGARDWFFLSSVLFDSRGENLLIEYDDRRNSTLYRAPLGTGPIQAVPSDGAHYSEFSFSADKKQAACIRQALTVPPEIALLDAESGRTRILTRLNPQFDSVRLRDAAERSWKNRFGHEVGGFLFLPDRPWKEERLPLLMVHYQFSNKFTTQAQWIASYPVQHFVEAGFAVLLFNYPRELGWKPGDFEAAAMSQVYNPLAGMEAAVRGLVEEGIADPKRVGVLGWSFGAFLAEMAITQSGLFQAASAGEGGLNNAGQYWVTGSAGMQRYLDDFFGGPPFGEAYGNYRRVAPALNADKMNIPLLREYGGDVGVQSLEFYMALRRLGKPVEQVIYPGAPHVFSLPSHRRASMERNLDWFRYWLQGCEDPDPRKTAQYRRWRALAAR